MNRVKEFLEKLKSRYKYLNCIETGTIRSNTENHNSTKVISDIIGDKGRLTSIDINPEAIRISKSVCKNAKNVEWIESSSVDYLSKTDEKFHFALLDSLNDAGYVFYEFVLLIKNMCEEGIIIVDDCGVDFNGRKNKSKAVKGVAIYNFCKLYEIPCQVIKGTHGNQLMIDLKGISNYKIMRYLTPYKIDKFLKKYTADKAPYARLDPKIGDIENYSEIFFEKFKKEMNL